MSNFFKASLLLFSAGAYLHANPENPSVVSGDVSFNTQGSTLTVTSNDTRAIVEWESFSVGSSETTTFTLPSSSSAILNRVTSTGLSYMSDIAGQITSNGHVYLVNPNGVLIEDGAVVNVNGFLASTLDIDNQEFLNASDLNLSGSDDTDFVIDHRGTITADHGDVVLIGMVCQSTGDISAENGTVALCAGSEMILQPNDMDNRMAIVTNTYGSQASYGVDSQGLIEAVRAELKADGNAYQIAINHGGVIHATGTSVTPDAVVLFRAHDGVVNVETASTITNTDYSNTGGFIAILGDEITVDGTVTAAGSNGGGEVYIGGGGDLEPNLPIAVDTTVSNATINVDSTLHHDGGKVVLQASDTVTFAGTIEARSGTSDGDGGYVALLAGTTLSDTGTIDVSARNSTGNDGTIVREP